MIWIASGQPPAFRQRLLQETQKLCFNYLQSHFSD
ncbi:MAG: hypothetical protein AAF773_19355 [Cyanobacteria bacterium P01_D01_bin.115]